MTLTAAPTETTAEIASYEPWAEEVRRLARARNAVILAHNYQVPWIQDVADFVGDSLELSRKAAETDADEIVFCGVHFMAETAAILSTDKRVLIPDVEAGCSLSATKSFKTRHQHDEGRDDRGANRHSGEPQPGDSTPPR